MPAVKLSSRDARRLGLKAKRHKYNAVRTTVDGRTFASKREAKRYGELRLLEREGRIWGLECQPRFILHVNGQKIGQYVADFQYFEYMDGQVRDQRVVEDAKGMKTPLYSWKKRHLQAEYGIVIREV